MRFIKNAITPKGIALIRRALIARENRGYVQYRWWFHSFSRLRSIATRRIDI